MQGRIKKDHTKVLLQTHPAERANDNALMGITGTRILALFSPRTGVTTRGKRHLQPHLEALTKFIINQAHNLEALQPQVCLQFAQGYFHGGLLGWQ